MYVCTWMTGPSILTNSVPTAEIMMKAYAKQLLATVGHKGYWQCFPSSMYMYGQTYTSQLDHAYLQFLLLHIVVRTLKTHGTISRNDQYQTVNEKPQAKSSQC